MNMMKASDFIAEFFKVQQTGHVFEVAGGMITHMLDSIHLLRYTKIISVHHEQAAAFAADAYGRCTGRPGIAFATSGPGATNLLTGIGSCYFDSSPAIFITGQVNRHEQKGDRNIRQLGFQETDIVSMATPITKKCYRVEHPEQLVPMLTEAFQLAIDGRPGPVLLDIPMDIQRAHISVAPIKYIEKSHPASEPQLEDKLTLLAEAIKHAQRPLILAGNGVACASAKSDLLLFAEMLGIPVVTSLMGLDAIPNSHPLRAGFIGTYGNRWSNIALGTADLLIVIGSRLDIRQTGADVMSFQGNKSIFHVDCDQGEINNRLQNCVAIVADAKYFLTKALLRFSAENFPSHIHWLREISVLKETWPDISELKSLEGINPNIFMHDLSQATREAAAYVSDVGNHQMWSAQSLEVRKDQLYITSGGMGAMGFALPAAIGASLALGNKPVVAIIGDGAFQMNIQELQTIVRNKLPIKIVVMNNQCLGMIRQFQDSYFEGRYQSTYWGYSAPDFCAVANAYGITAGTITTDEEAPAAVSWLWGKASQPQLLQVMIHTHTNVYPKIAFGKPISEMEPLSKPIEMEST